MYKAYLDNTLFWDQDSDDQGNAILSGNLILEANKAGSLTVQVPPSNALYNAFDKFDYIDLYRDDVLFWSGREYSESKDFETINTETAEGLLAVLNDTICRPFTHQGNLRQLVENIISSHNTQVEAAKQITVRYIGLTDNNVYRQYTEYETSWKRLADLIEVYGGSMTVKKIEGILTLDWINSYSAETEQTINFGSNLLDIVQYSETADIATVILPLGAEIEEEDGRRRRLTIASVNDGSDVIEDAAAIAEFGRIVKIVMWDDVTLPGNLKAKARAWLDDAKYSKMTINVTAVDLANAGEQVSHFELGKSVRVVSEAHGIDHLFHIERMELNLLDPTQDQLTLGAAVDGYVGKTQRMTSEYYDLIKKVYADYAPNTKVQEVISIIEQHETEIEQNAEAIALRATKTELQQAVTQIGNDIQSAETRITAAYQSEIRLAADEITSQVSQDLEEFGELVESRYSTIEQTANQISAAVASERSTASGQIDLLRTQLEQTENSLRAEITENEQLLSYFELKNDGFYIGSGLSTVKLRETATTVQFVEATTGAVLAEFNTDGLVAKKVAAHDQLSLAGQWAIRKGDTAPGYSEYYNMDIVWIG